MSIMKILFPAMATEAWWVAMVALEPGGTT